MTPTVEANPFRRMWAECGDAVLEAVSGVGRSGWFVLGAEVRQFEEALAQTQQRRFAIGCASGLDAIEIALRAVGLSPGQRVLTTPLSAFATTLAIVRAGGVPVFVDVDEHGLLDLDQARQVLRAEPDIRFMVPVNLFGHTLDPARLTALATEHALQIVEDCAQSVGARFDDRPAGHGSAAMTLSFYPTKNLGALGDGGAVLVDDEGLAERCRQLRDYGQARKYEHVRLGLNSRLDELQAAILRQVFLPRLAGWTARRTAIANRYTRALDDVPGVDPVARPARCASAWHLYPVRVAADRRDACLESLRAQGVQAGIHYPFIIPDQPALDGVAATCLRPPVRARAFASEELSLPINPYLGDDEIDHTIGALAAWAR